MMTVGRSTNRYACIPDAVQKNFIEGYSGIPLYEILNTLDNKPGR